MTTSRLTRSWKLLPAALVSLSLVAAACGGDDDDSASDATEAPAADVTEAPTDATEAPATDSTEPDSSDSSGLLAELQADGVVNVGLANEIPYGYETEEGEIKGEAPDVARAVLAELGIDEIDATVVDFGNLISGLQAGQYDMIAAGMYITPERAEQIIFSDPDYCVGYRFAVADGNPLGIGGGFDSIVETGAKLAVLSGAVDEDYARWAEVPDDQIELFSDVNAQYDALLAGRVDAVGGTALTVSNQVEATDGIEATDAFTPLDENGDEIYGCGAFGFIDQGFRDAFNAELKKLQADGTVEEITTGYGFAAEDVQLAASLTVDDLAGG